LSARVLLLKKMAQQAGLGDIRKSLIAAMAVEVQALII